MSGVGVGGPYSIGEAKAAAFAVPLSGVRPGHGPRTACPAELPWNHTGAPERARHYAVQILSS